MAREARDRASVLRCTGSAVREISGAAESHGRGVGDEYRATVGTAGALFGWRGFKEFGGGMVLDGKLFHGPHYSAAEIGHLTVNENGPLCGCGNHGCIETYVGNGYFIKELRRRLEASGHRVEVVDFLDAVAFHIGPLLRWFYQVQLRMAPHAREAGPRPVRPRRGAKTGHRLGGAARRVASGRAQAARVFGLGRSAEHGGGLAQEWSLFFGPLKASLRKKAFPIAVRSVKVLPAILGVDAGLIGAAALAFGPVKK